MIHHVPLAATDPPDLYGMAWSEDVVRFVMDKGVHPLHLCIAGSHMWNLHRPTSDLDVRGIYLAPIRRVLALHPGDDWIDPVDQIVNAEANHRVDFQLWELGKALRLLQGGNGNVVQQLLAPTTFYDARSIWSPSPPIDLAELARKHLTRKLAGYYRGYFESQKARSAKSRGGKSLAYSYRELYEGIHVMHFGTLEFDWTTLRNKLEDCKLVQKSALLDHYMARSEWETPVGDEQLHAFEREWSGLTAILDAETAKSILPADYDGAEELNQALWQVRRWQAANAITEDLATF